MPELPEVQTIVDYLNLNVLNLLIKKVIVHLPKILKNKTPAEFENLLVNHKITNIKRLGKYLLFFLDNNLVLSVHLRMEGKFYYQPKDEWFNLAHTHIIIEFENGMQLRYNDTRQFGTFHIYEQESFLDSKELKKIALDPLDANFTPQYLYEKLKKSNKAIKTALLDQSNVSGIGNIYADEILFATKIFPTTLAKDLTIKDYENIAKEAKRILLLSIQNKGTTIHTYKFGNDETGMFQKMLLVHTHAKKPCQTCGTIIRKTKVNGRGTYYCSNCQNQK
ncbi:DNA-formamidopyrimidine glycosylase [Ureaplasma urealyticum]|uniref:DNA-formamidopyrimidine glycosylase n=1 Tax=Ureaplasma urealyticum TaxID=2130 RepID=UPI0001793C6C|nr:DNA-formamidopyrimidine glycosylase [Ureaplasma urealyticum]EDX53430.1 formamidopyrimidine-DNA glycosylase [Ureaplasma urealyticum serovar 12 str. ATCC 33696]EDY74326.1 formamidopyrimidine-DNA glycosylase [Ureaplasma urealyticum serovar 4 str. ATCC 27816]UIU14870.1 DNA-formamidopyrimidine glycosylase [Ureaplasma urealyticum]